MNLGTCISRTKMHATGKNTLKNTALRSGGGTGGRDKTGGRRDLVTHFVPAVGTAPRTAVSPHPPLTCVQCTCHAAPHQRMATQLAPVPGPGFAHPRQASCTYLKEEERLREGLWRESGRNDPGSRAYKEYRCYRFLLIVFTSE